MSEPKEYLLLKAYLCGLRMGYHMKARDAARQEAAERLAKQLKPDPEKEARMARIFAWARGEVLRSS